MLIYTISWLALTIGLCSSRCPREEQFSFSQDTRVSARAECSIPPSCDHWFDAGVNESGVYPVKPDDGEPFQVYCDMTTDEGGWTVFQRRKNGALGFSYRHWSEYENGFGDLAGEFWLGLKNIHRLTGDEINNVLRVDLKVFYGSPRYAEYDVFNVGDRNSDYILTVGGYNGNAGDSLASNNGMKFSTYNRDNDRSNSWSSCAASRGAGGWWYNNCGRTNLNGYYYSYCTSNYRGMKWETASPYNMISTEIKTRIR